MDKPHTPENAFEVDRVQTGVRIGKRLLKVLKAVAELKHISLGDLLEGIVLHAFEGKCAFSAQTLKNIDQFRSPLSWPHFGSYGAQNGVERATRDCCPAGARTEAAPQNRIADSGTACPR